MSRKDEKVKPLVDRITEIERQIEEHQRRIAELTVARRNLSDVLAEMKGEAPSNTPDGGRKPRVANVKGTVLDIMAAAGVQGRTSAEVVAIANERVPGVARDTISSVLSRLKTAGALVYDGLRYYEAKHAPRDGEQRPFAPHIKAV